tara:strand:- start:40874 stop:41218 length:345 start_codon:yes stop_codon:yes gene_type:complete
MPSTDKPTYSNFRKHSNLRCFVDRDRFQRAILSGDIGGGAILVSPRTATSVGTFEAIYIGFNSHNGMNYVAWRRGNEPLEKFLKRADKLDAYYDRVTAFRSEDSEEAEGWAPKL